MDRTRLHRLDDIIATAILAEVCGVATGSRVDGRGGILPGQV